MWRLLQEGVWTVKTVESEVRRTRHEGAEKDGDSAVFIQIKAAVLALPCVIPSV